MDSWHTQREKNADFIIPETICSLNSKWQLRLLFFSCHLACGEAFFICIRPDIRILPFHTSVALCAHYLHSWSLIFSENRFEKPYLQLFGLNTAKLHVTCDTYSLHIFQIVVAFPCRIFYNISDGARHDIPICRAHGCVYVWMFEHFSFFFIRSEREGGELLQFIP